MKYAPIAVLETARLRLRKITMEDVDAYYHRLAGREAVTRYMLWKTHEHISESVASIQKVLGRYETGCCYRWGIALRQTDSLIGIIELLHFDEESNACSFAYMLAEEFWNLGYGTEALRAVFGFAFDQMGIKTITADHFLENGASGRVMEKAGMHMTRILPGKYEKNGRKYDAVEYTITSEQ